MTLETKAILGPVEFVDQRNSNVVLPRQEADAQEPLNRAHLLRMRKALPHMAELWDHSPRRAFLNWASGSRTDGP